MTDAPKPAGFTATELLEANKALRPTEMTIERAEAIVRAMANRSFLAMGMPQHPEGDLAGVSLVDMIYANALVKARGGTPAPGGGTILHAYCDDRLIAASFALENYDADKGAIVASSKDMHFAKVMAVLPQTIEPADDGAGEGN